jgi:hypothetical protein
MVYEHSSVKRETHEPSIGPKKEQVEKILHDEIQDCHAHAHSIALQIKIARAKTPLENTDVLVLEKQVTKFETKATKTKEILKELKNGKILPGKALQKLKEILTENR